MNAGTPDGVRLHQAIIDAPHDDALKLIYADWLEEYGSLERAAVIRGGWRYLQPAEFWLWFNTPSIGQRFGATASCHVRTEYSDGERETARVGHQVAVGEDHWEFGFRLGFPERIRLPLADWMKYGKALVKEFPLRRVELSDRKPSTGRYSRRDEPGWYLQDKAYWLWELDRPNTVSRDQLPWAIYQHVVRSVSPHACQYLSEKEAHAALSAACLKFASS